MADQPDFSLMNSPIRVSDAAMMLKKQISANERPFTAAMLKHNNKLVDEWHNSVLKKIANDKSTIPSGNVISEWEIFNTGKTIGKFMELYNNKFVCRPPKDIVDFWVKKFTECSIEELIAIGPPAVGHGWKLIIDETFIFKQVEKWEKIYSLSDDPLEWRKLANKHPSLWNAEHASPFWAREQLEDISQKVTTVTRTIVSPC